MEGQAGKILNVLPTDIITPKGDYVTIFRDSSDGKYYGKLPNGNSEQINASGFDRDYQNIVLAFNTDRQPNLVYDTLVIATLKIVALAGQKGNINADIKTGAFTYITIGTVRNEPVVGDLTMESVITFIVPKGRIYRISSVGTATNSITSIFELQT